MHDELSTRFFCHTDINKYAQFCFFLLYGAASTPMHRLSEQRRLEEEERQRQEAIENQLREVDERRKALLQIMVDNGITTVRVKKLSRIMCIHTK
jgi:hypothetical protein